MKRQLRVVIAGGGTTGHLSPGLAVADVLKPRGAEILFIGSPRGPEGRIVPQSGYAFEPIKIVGRKRGMNPRNLVAVGRLAIGVVRCVRLLKRFRPDVILGTGGYVSLPPALASRLLRIPLVVHEQNSVPGLANRVASRFAARVAVSFPGTETRFGAGAVLSGNPVRKQIEEMDRPALRGEAIRHFGLENGRVTVLVTGGSQGAQSINEAVAGSYVLLRNQANLQILHMTGPTKLESVAEAVEASREDDDPLIYRSFGYTDRMELAYAAADIVLCRAGASTLAEIAVTGLPAIIVPLPAAIDEDQRRNAEYFASKGAGVLVTNENLTPDRAAREIKALAENPESASQMASKMRKLAIRGAGERLADIVLEVAG